jgi:cytochrome c553
MWKGLIGPSDDRWLEGAQALTTVPLNLVAMSVTPTSDLDVDDGARVRLYARRALAPQPQDARAEVFGQLLATCAHCHATLRDR